MDAEALPIQLRALLAALATALRAREPAIRQRVERLRAENPGLSADQLADRLIRQSRRRIAATGAASGAAAIMPGLGTLVSLGTATSQGLYALEQETELVMAIAIIYGHELAGSDDRVLEALVVVGIAGGAVKLRENVLVAGGQRVALAAFRSLPRRLLSQAGGSILRRVLVRPLSTQAAGAAARLIPLAVGVATGAGFDWMAVTALGRAAKRYYGPGGPAARFPQLAAPGAEDPGYIERGG